MSQIKQYTKYYRQNQICPVFKNRLSISKPLQTKEKIFTTKQQKLFRKSASTNEFYQYSKHINTGDLKISTNRQVSGINNNQNEKLNQQRIRSCSQNEKYVYSKDREQLLKKTNVRLCTIRHPVKVNNQDQNRRTSLQQNYYFTDVCRDQKQTNQKVKKSMIIQIQQYQTHLNQNRVKSQPNIYLENIKRLQKEILKQQKLNCQLEQFNKNIRKSLQVMQKQYEQANVLVKKQNNLIIELSRQKQQVKIMVFERQQKLQIFKRKLEGKTQLIQEMEISIKKIEEQKYNLLINLQKSQTQILQKQNVIKENIKKLQNIYLQKAKQQKQKNQKQKRNHQIFVELVKKNKLYEDRLKQAQLEIQFLNFNIDQKTHEVQEGYNKIETLQNKRNQLMKQIIQLNNEKQSNIKQINEENNQQLIQQLTQKSQYLAIICAYLGLELNFDNLQDPEEKTKIQQTLKIIKYYGIRGTNCHQNIIQQQQKIIFQQQQQKIQKLQQLNQQLTDQIIKIKIINLNKIYKLWS